MVVHQRTFDVRFSNERDLVAGFLKDVRDKREPCRDLAFYIRYSSRRVRVHPRQQRRARRQAQSVHHERIAECASLVADAIHVRRLRQLIPSRGEFVPAKPLPENADDVRFIALVVEGGCEGFEVIVGNRLRRSEQIKELDANAEQRYEQAVPEGEIRARGVAGEVSVSAMEGECSSKCVLSLSERNAIVNNQTLARFP